MCKTDFNTLNQIVFFYYLPFSGIASCVGTAGTVTWCLHLTRPCCVALGQVMRVVSPDWLRRFVNWVFLIPFMYYHIMKDISFNLVRHSLPGFELGTPTTARYQKIDALGHSAMVPAFPVIVYLQQKWLKTDGKTVFFCTWESTQKRWSATKHWFKF